MGVYSVRRHDTYYFLNDIQSYSGNLREKRLAMSVDVFFLHNLRERLTVITMVNEIPRYTLNFFKTLTIAKTSNL